MIVSDAKAEEEKAGLFRRLTRGVKSKIGKTEVAKEFYQSEEYKKAEALKGEFRDFKQNLSE